MADELHTWDVTVTGRVQGVYYRAFTQRAAAELGVRGWVRNLPDGSVIARLQHEHEGPLQALVGRLRKGPPASHVDDVSVTPVVGAERCSGFEIARD